MNDNGRHGQFPDFSITVSDDPNRQYPIAKACKGTNDMIHHLENACYIIVPKSASGWRHIEVFRGQQALGNLWWVKQAFHLWRDRKDLEAGETGQEFRLRRRPNRAGVPSGGVWHHGRFGVWENSVFVPDPDQSRYLATG